MFILLLVIGLIGLFFGGIAFTVSRSWRVTIPAFIAISLGMGFATLTLVSVPFSVVLSLSGCLAAVVFLITIFRETHADREEANPPLSWIFRCLFLLLVLVVALAINPAVSTLFHHTPMAISLGASWLIGVGLLNIGMSDYPMRTGIGLVVLLQGFTLAFLWVEQSVLLIGLLALLFLAISISFSYLSLKPAVDPSGAGA